MDFRPDLGWTWSDELSSELRVRFGRHPIPFVTRLGKDLLTSATYAVVRGVEHEVTLDFGRDKLHQLSQFVRVARLQKAITMFRDPYEGPSLVRFARPLWVSVIAHLGRPQETPDGWKYVPWVVEQFGKPDRDGFVDILSCDLIYPN